LAQQRGLRTAAELLRQLVKQIGGDAAKPLDAFEGVGARASAAGVLDFRPDGRPRIGGETAKPVLPGAAETDARNRYCR